MFANRTERISGAVQQKFSELTNAIIYSSHEQRIYKIHGRLKGQNKEAFEPHMLSIGPYHRGKENLKAIEKYKVIYLKELLERSGEQSPARYIEALTKIEERARRFYADEVRLSTDDFVEMMLLDGFFIVELLRKFHFRDLRRHGDDKIFLMDWLFNAVLLDLLLIENQVPFFVLVQLHDMTVNFSGQHEYTLVNLALILTKLFPSYTTKQDGSATIHQDQVIHLLDLVHKSCTYSFAKKINSATTGTADDRGAAENDFSLEYIKSTTELKECGVKFKKAVEDKPWLDITWEGGAIKIPHLLLDDNTECVLRNLIVFEQYYIVPYKEMTYITDYVKVMDLLVSSPSDVEKLRNRQIIKNKLGDDAAVSTMFNSLVKNVVFSEKQFCYRDVFKEVNKFSNKNWNVWRAKLMRDYFNTPWSIIAVIAAVVLFILTFLQTIFAIPK